MNKIKFKMNSLFKQKAFTLQEGAIVLAVLTIISSLATFRIIGFRRQSLVLKEQSVIRALTKAAILYNTANDKWYGMVASENIFTGLLENPPPFYITDVFGMMNIAGNGKDWKLAPPSAAGAGKWWIGCPHQSGFGAYGTWWTFYVEGGKIITPYGPQHTWP
jgi:type II secretory pathway pseudopilin PulG